MYWQILSSVHEALNFPEVSYIDNLDIGICTV